LLSHGFVHQDGDSSPRSTPEEGGQRMETINYEVFAGITVLHLTIALVVVLLLLIGLQSLRKEATPGQEIFVKASCSGCGWRGKMSKYQRKCPKCGGEIVADRSGHS
jgi:hypothetical protein